MLTDFFPKNKIFWLCHGVGLGLLGVVEIATVIMIPHAVLFKLLSTLVLWPILFTAVVLIFRWLYNNHPWLQGGVGKLIPLVVIYSTITALIAALVIVGILMPFFWALFVPPEQLATGDFDVVKIVAPVVINAGLSGNLFIAAWIFIYIFVKENRRAKESELNNLRLQNNLREAKISSLSNQINPHFLFNALNNIRFMIHENQQHADNMITALSEILRYSLASSEKDKVMLAEEMEMTQRYIDIVKLQYENKLNFVNTIEPSLEACLIPPMCIQILVENAVKHGIERVRKGGNLELTVVSKNNGIQLKVKNPIPKETSEKSEHCTGTGLVNIRNRLELLYEGRASLTTNNNGKVFTAELLLPKEKNE